MAREGTKSQKSLRCVSINGDRFYHRTPTVVYTLAGFSLFHVKPALSRRRRRYHYAHSSHGEVSKKSKRPHDKLTFTMSVVVRQE